MILKLFFNIDQEKSYRSHNSSTEFIYNMKNSVVPQIIFDHYQFMRYTIITHAN